ncbi:helix-turn-helix transcriptional regulator [Paenibacillus campinasensis]|uniref:Helix-turn-helix transcriptional regulator n=1 Tax=Paenibacillus campinasensis TaxID=66347 RepID=A0ABW9TA60_9BACL|nr:LuxR C-terminal-related transcriptional regulator [Paenibacillus campinasensis]MUG68046.1 helix-turn-helix transcriptional regulator [Paenibacillus campinasensis]
MRVTTGIMKYKLEIPVPRKHWINRSHLHSSLGGVATQGITLIVAPAGSGKTTAMTQIVHGSKQRISWVSLDEHDNDLHRFWRYLVHTLQPHLSAGASDRLLSMLAEFSEHSVRPFLDQCLNELHEVAGPISLALDDYHVITRCEIHDSLNYWLDHLPPRIQVVIASRTEPPLKGLQTWHISGKMQRIGSHQLAFTPDHAEELCVSVLGRALPREWVISLVERTEGWAAGLQLVLITLLQRPSEQWPEWIRSQDMGKYIDNYLFREVWSGLDESTRIFVLETSVLKRFNTPLCEAVTGISDSEEKISDLQSRDLFLLPAGGDYYRYHHLAGDFYEAMLRNQSPERWNILKRKACHAYARIGWYEEAVDLAFEAEAYDLATGLLDQHLHELVMRGEFRLIQEWFDRFPESFTLPGKLRLICAFVRTFMGKFDDARDMMAAMEAELDHSSSNEEQLENVSGLFFVKANHAFHSGQFQDWFRFADSIQQRLPQDPVFFEFNYNHNQPFVRYTTFGLKGALTDTTSALGWQITSILEQNGWGDSLMCQYVLQALAEGYYEWNELDQCKELLDRITAGSRYLNIAGLFVPVRLTMARLSLVRGDRAGARATIEQTLDRLEGASKGVWCQPLWTALADMDIQEGAVDRAEARMKDMNISPDQRVHLGSVQETLTLVRLLIAQRRIDESRSLLTRLLLQAEESGMVNIAVSIMVLQACADVAQGKKQDAFERIYHALARVKPFRYIRTFADEGVWLLELLEEMLAASAFDDQPELKTYARTLAAVLDAESAAVNSGPNPTVTGHSLTPQETEVVKLLHLGYTNQDIADELGLTLGTVKVYLNRIYSKLGVRSRTQAVLATTPAPPVSSIIQK